MERPETLLTPGPVPVSPKVLAAQGAPLLYHRGPAFGEVMRTVADGIAYMLKTEAQVLIHTSSGTGGLESAVANAFSAGDQVLVVSIGNFGERFKKITTAYGLDVQLLEYEWGLDARHEDVAAMLRDLPECKGVFVTHSETSTGVVNDLKAIAGAVKDHPALLVVDTVSGVGAVPIEMDAWGIDIAITGSQKAIAGPPGVAFVAVSDRAWAAHETSTLPRFYFDWTIAREAAERANPESPWTPAISTLMACKVAIDEIRDEGIDRAVARHALLGKATRAGLLAMGMEPFAANPERSSVVTCVRAPEGVDTSKIVSHVRKRFGLVIAGGQGKLKGKVFRVGHLGWVDRFDIIRAIAAIETAFVDLDLPVKVGVGVEASMEVFREADREFGEEVPA